ncbi:HNH endonuclease [Gynuella sunshinyii]|uniref:HNH endonuclease n=1 Tax=Gynuella sunshinyii YC6258 TaxID=1445510 RepID=A0A0C5VVZ0_9GAMM|nr:hypothetical protein [Gynuella sunshinyii]AJQ97493.1 hypothetical Protein YC6258_05465 [Gynuella sunshinyii YC6258]
MNLYQTVEPSLLKLKRRLAKEGILDISHMDYEKYLRTVFWKEIKEWIAERDDHRCVICRTEKSKFCDLEVHHRSYELEVLEGRNSEMLVSLCPRCHKLIEFYDDGRKRLCLHEKDEKYHELVQIYINLESNGLPLKIDKSSRRGSDLFEITYIGSSEFLTFCSLESLMFGFVLDIHHKHRCEVKIPLPFGRDKFYQKSGAKVSNKASGKEIINVKIIDGSPLIKASNHCAYPLYDYLVSYISQREHWYVV